MSNEDKVIRLPDKEWWGITPKKHYSYTIEWTPKYGGYVRCKVNTSTGWKFKPCEFVRFAESIGNNMLVKYV